MKWLDEEECKETAKQIENSFHFANCAGFMDGTLLSLVFALTSDDAAD